MKGNAEKHLHEILGYSIIMNFNVDGTFNKKSLKQYSNVYTGILGNKICQLWFKNFIIHCRFVPIDAISQYDDLPDSKLRLSFQKQKKKFFKQASRAKAKQQQEDNEIEAIEEESTNTNISNEIDLILSS